MDEFEPQESLSIVLYANLYVVDAALAMEMAPNLYIRHWRTEHKTFKVAIEDAIQEERRRRDVTQV